MQIQIYGYTNMGDRPENEDTYICEMLSDSAMYAVLCDGLGAHSGSKLASQITLNALQQCKDIDPLPSADHIRACLNMANQTILSKREDSQQMKTTAAALYVREDSAVWAHIGDTRIYHFCNGELVHFTNDHTVCQMAVESGQISRKDIPSHPDRSKLLRVVGEPEIDPEIHAPISLEPGQHAFLLCSDGLWECLQEDEIMLDLNKSISPDQWIYYLRCRAQMRKFTEVDNNTAIAAFLYV